MRANLSYWEQRNYLADRDLIIVGGGLVGLSTAIQFVQLIPQASVLVVERHALPLGASTRNAGFACLGSPSELLADLKAMGMEDTIDLVRRRAHGIRRLRSLVPDEAMQFEPTGGTEVFTKDQTDLYQTCLDHLQLFNLKCRSFLDTELFITPSKQVKVGIGHFAHSISAPLEGLIDPAAMIKFLTCKAQSLGIEFLHAEVRSFDQLAERAQLETTLGPLRTRYLVIATNGFTRKLIPQIGIRPARNIVLVTSPVRADIKGAFHHQAGYYYFRHIENRILIGGARHLHAEREATDHFDIPDDLKAHLISFLKKYIIPNQSFAIDSEWSGIMGFGRNKIPTVEQVSPQVMVVAGLGGMGIALGSQLGYEASQRLSQLI